MSELSFEPLLGRHPQEIHFTNSEIQTYKDCKRKWYLGYYLGLKKKSQDKMGALPLGSRIHDSLEKYYVTGRNPVWVYKELLAADRVAFQADTEYLTEEDLEKFDKEGELGRIMVEGYVEWVEENSLDADYEFVSAEQTLSVPLDFGDDRNLILKGKVDMIVQDKMNEEILIRDHKTMAASALSQYHKNTHMSEQLMLYINLARANGFKVDGGEYNLLKKVKRTGSAKPPFYDRIKVRFNDKQLDAYWKRTMSTVSDMLETRERLDNGESHLTACYPRPSNDCSWKCDFYTMCTMMDDGSDADRYLHDKYEQTDPNARYNTEETEEEN